MKKKVPAVGTEQKSNAHYSEIISAFRISAVSLSVGTGIPLTLSIVQGTSSGGKSTRKPSGLGRSAIGGVLSAQPHPSRF